MERLEDKFQKLQEKTASIEHRVEAVELQNGRITSHIESEVGLARQDIARIEKRLFGAEDEEYGGRIGILNRRIYRMEVWALAILCASGMIGFLFMAYQFFARAVTVVPTK